MYEHVYTCISPKRTCMYDEIYVNVTLLPQPGQESTAQERYLARASDSLCCSACISELSDKLTFMWLSCRPAEL